MYSRFTTDLILVFDSAKQESKVMQTNSITTEQLFLGIFKNSTGLTEKISKESGLKEVMDGITHTIFSLSKPDKDFSNTSRFLFTPKAFSILEGAIMESEMMNHFHLGPEHLILSLFLEENIEPTLREIFNKYKIEPTKIRTITYKCISDLYPIELKKKINSIYSNKKKLVTAAYRQRYFLEEIRENNGTPNLCKFYALRLLKSYTNDRLIVGMREDDRISYRKNFNFNKNITNFFNKLKNN